MAEDMGRESEEQRARRRATETDRQPDHARGEQANIGDGLHYSADLRGDRRLGNRSNAPVRTSVMHGMQRTHGNSAVQRFLQRGTSAGLAQPEGDEYLARRIEALSGSGSKLPFGVQAQLEDGLGADLSGVRVHTGADADQLARSMSAVAFTSGRDIFFRDGAYNPGAEEGLRLLAHETTHTVQQSAGPVEGTPSAGGVSISDPSDSFEQEAEQVADSVMSGGEGAVAGERSAQGAFTGTSIQRFTEPTPWMNASPFVEPTPWAGKGGRSSGWNGMPTGPNLGIEPANPGAGWMQSPHTPGPQIDNPAFPGGGPFFNPTPNVPFPFGPQIDNPAFPGGGPFFNPTPGLGGGGGGGGFGGGGGGGGFDPAFPGGGPFFNPTPNIPLPFHPMPGGGSGFGWQPSGLDERPGPWAYYKGNGKSGLDMGVEGGFGLFHGEATMGGIPVTDDLLYAQGKLGAWDNDQGGMRHGGSGTAGVGKMSFNNGGQVSGDVEALTATAEASWGDDGATLGAQATAVGGSMTFGAPTKASDKDESVRLGLSEGIGLAGRLHWGDKDKDGHREYGLGADFGPFSFDLKSEDPLRTLAKSAGGPLADYLLGTDNTTDKAVGYASDVWDSAKAYGAKGVDYAANAYDSVAGAASSAWDAASDFLW